jgi:hypothetical protein
VRLHNLTAPTSPAFLSTPCICSALHFQEIEKEKKTELATLQKSLQPQPVIILRILFFCHICSSAFRRCIKAYLFEGELPTLGGGRLSEGENRSNYEKDHDHPSYHTLPVALIPLVREIDVLENVLVKS